MKDQILKIAKVKSEKDFYKKYPTEEAFMAKHGKALKKAAMGTSMVNKQLKQLTDFSNPPIAQNGMPISYNDRLASAQSFVANSQQETPAPKENRGVFATLGKIANEATGGLGGGDMAEAIGGLMKQGGHLPVAQNGLGNIANALGAFTKISKDASGKSTATGGLGSFAADMFGGSGTAEGIMNVGAKGALGAGGAGLGAGAAAAGLGILDAGPQILGGIQAIKEQKNAIKKADQSAQVSGLSAQAAESKEVGVKQHNYVRPEDSLLTGANPTGTGTSYLANGGEIQNTYAPGDLYIDLSYEPLNDSNVKQFAYGGNLPEAEFGDYFQDSGQAQIGGAAGQAIGSALFGPLGGMAGKFLGNVAGNLLGGAADANKLARYEDQTKKNTERIADAGMINSFQSQNASFMENGGWMNPEYNPQVIAKFGEYNVKDLLKPPHDADMLRAGGHLKEYTPPSARAMYTGRGQFAMGGDLQVYRGKAEPISYNPFLPEGGETVMFKGPSHDDGGMPISYGQNGVEVEGGEPAVKLQDGGSPDGNLVVFGNMKIDDMAAREIGIDAAKGKKYKRFIDDLSKFESKQNKTVSKGTELVNLADTNDPFDQLTMNSGQAMIMGGNAKLQKAAAVKQNTAAVQNAILDTAKELGVKSDALAEGRLIKDKTSDMAMFGAKMETAQDGKGFADMIAKGKPKKTQSKSTNKKTTKATSKIYNPPTFADLTVSPNNPTANVWDVNESLPSPNVIKSAYDTSGNYFDPSGNLVDQSGILPGEFSADQIAKGKGTGKVNWGDIAQTVMSSAMPLFRPTDQEPLDPAQLMPEYFALASNQLEPVRAQQFQPRLKEAYSISLQDQLNEVDQQTRAAQRMAGNNPAAQAQIAAQAAEAKNKIRGEQLRMNQGLQMGVYNENIAALNQAQLQNLQILDQQYIRQAQAKSNTKAQAQAALSSIASKIAQNKLENKQLGIYENLYNYRFGPRGQAINFNAPAQFNLPDVGDVDNLTPEQKSKVKEYYEKIVSKDKLGNVTGSKEKTSSTKAALNGTIVKALKNL